MSGKKSKYPLISESAYWQMVQNNEPYNGFVEYESGVFSFVLSEVTVVGKQITESKGDFTQYLMDTQIKYQTFKPLRRFTSDSSEYKKAQINPQNQDGRNPARTIKATFCVSEFYTSFEKNFPKFMRGYYDPTAKVEGMSYKRGFVSDSKTREKADETNQWVNESGIFYLDNYTDINTAEYANFILGCLIYGVGPENIAFPTDGTVSNTLKNAGIVKDALDLFYKKNKGKTEKLLTFSDEISGTTFNNNFRSIFANGIFHPETFIGSANVRIEQLDKSTLKVTVFNISSLTSGDLEKHLPILNEYPMSIIRQHCDGKEKTEYGNISQTYSFTLPIDFNRLK